SPGIKSAEIGHHFGNPTNYFWRCLFWSGLTPEQISPLDDSTLPERFAYGLTNLVPRPTAEQGELAPDERAAGVPVFLSKVAQFRPRIVCYVGNQIADTVRSSLKRTSSSSIILHARYGIEPYKLVNSSDSVVLETLFFAMPSTSGRVVGYDRQKKIEVFVSLRDTLVTVKRGEMDTGHL
ncbi:DNA glycosylase, partial [Fistulina hepatica ATCC 64428]